MDVYLETGTKRVFAGAIEWPGWCRSGRDEKAALQALLDYGPRYARVMRRTGLGFAAPTKISDLKVIERLKGSTTTDFGSPGEPPAFDGGQPGEAELRRMESILRACWRQFDAAVRVAQGKSLRTGPRGGGRDLNKMVEHVVEAEEAYVGRLGWEAGIDPQQRASQRLEQVRKAIVAGIRASSRGTIPARGPKGGKRWSARYCVRRTAWHALDHAWEIEDRMD